MVYFTQDTNLRSFWKEKMPDENLFSTGLNHALSSLLKPLLPEGTRMESTILLRAYCSFQYLKIPVSIRPQRSKFILELNPSQSGYWTCDMAFTRFSVAKFLLSVIPVYVGDPLGLLRSEETAVFIRKAKTHEKPHVISAENRELLSFSFGFAVVAIKEIYNKIQTCRSASLKDHNLNEQEDYSGNINVSDIYNEYVSEAEAVDIPYFDKQSFKSYVEAICYVSQTSPRQLLDPAAIKCTSMLINTLLTELGASYKDVLDFIFYATTDSTWEGKIKESSFSQGYLSQPQSQKDIDHLYYLISGQVSSGNILECLEVFKKKNKFSKRNNEGKRSIDDSAYKKNDSSLEISISLRLFISEVISEENPSCLIILPSPAFISAWAAECVLNGIKVEFIMPEDISAKIMEMYFSPNSFYAPAPREDFSFKGFDAWIHELSQHKQMKQNRILIFENRYPTLHGKSHLSKEEKNEIKLKNQRASDLICSKASDDTIFFGLSPDVSLNDIQYLSGALLASSDTKVRYMSDIYVIPRRGKKGVEAGQSSKKKVFWKIKPSEQNEPTTAKCQYLKAAPKIILSSNQLPIYAGSYRAYIADNSAIVCKDMSKFLTCPASLRAFITDRKLKENKVKNSPQEFLFTPEIRVFYTTKIHKQQNKNNEKISNILVTYVRKYKDKDELEATGNQLVPSKKEIPISLDFSVSEIEDKIVNSYLPEKIESHSNKENSREIRTVIAESYKTHFFGKDMISIGTYIYIHPELDRIPFDIPKNAGAEKERYYLYELLWSIRAKFIRFLEIDDINEALDQVIPERSESLNAKILRSIYNVLEEARKQHLCKDNVIAKFLADEERVTKAFYHLRQAYVKRILSVDEFRSVYDVIIDKLREDASYIGILIKLLTGLDSHIVCALSKADFRNCPSYPFHLFDVYRQASGNGEDILTLHSDDDIRRIPCMPILAERIDMIPKEQAGGLIVQCEDEAKVGRSSFKPCVLDAYAKDVINTAGIKGIDITISTDDGSGLEVDLGKYKGDIFRENIRYWMLKFGFNNDEIAYLLGNKRPTTFGNYYCDFSNDFTQLRLYTKILRLQAYLLEDRENKKQPIIHDYIPGTLANEGNVGNAVNLAISAPSSRQITININCPHGYISQHDSRIDVSEEFDIKEER